MANDLQFTGVPVPIKGVEIDPMTRCTHFGTITDIVAIKFRCCNTYYACFDCHEELANHAPMIWPLDKFDERGVLCGACQTEITINGYMESAQVCPNCGHKFNSKYVYHYHLYFEQE
ncbi:MAG: CHY zinc finger protein [Candidatus Kariarchaeaceae archaeon]